MRPPVQERPAWGIQTWLLLCAGLTAAGWGLSAIHQLNPRGYAYALVLLATGLVWREQRRHFAGWESLRPSRVARRMKRALPMSFLVLSALTLLGALLYLPDNFDALAYRVPRILHWLAHGQWHWVHTAFPRLNVRACGQEWVIAPLIALTGSLRWTFLPSFISFLLLPGLFFSMFTRMGSKPRVAWHFMWLCPTGYCYLTEAGGLANDIMGATFGLAAFDFALRLRRSGRVEDLWYFLLAAALLTGAKASNLLLMLPLGLLVLPRWRTLFARPVATFGVMTLAALASFLPTAFFNWLNCGDWSGMRLEGPMKSYAAQLGINSVNLALLNFSPPIFPFTAQWTSFLNSLHVSQEAVRAWTIGEITDEGGSGLGAGLCYLLVISLVARGFTRKRGETVNAAKEGSLWWKFILWSPWISLFGFCLKAQVVNSCSRLVMPFWAALLAPILVFWFDSSLTRRRWWKGLSWLAVLTSLALVVLSPNRPLWPAQTILGWLQKSHPSSALSARAQKAFVVSAQRPNAFAPLVAGLPKDATLFGMVTFDDPEASLWWPVGSRRIEHVTPDDTLEQVQARGIKYILAPEVCQALSWPVQDVIEKYHAEVVGKVPVQIRVSSPPEVWYILRIPTAHAFASKTASMAQM